MPLVQSHLIRPFEHDRAKYRPGVALNPEAAQAFTAERVLRTRPGIVFRAVVAVVLTTLGIWMFVLTAHGITRASLLWVYYVYPLEIH